MIVIHRNALNYRMSCIDGLSLFHFMLAIDRYLQAVAWCVAFFFNIHIYIYMYSLEVLNTIARIVMIKTLNKGTQIIILCYLISDPTFDTRFHIFVIFV